MLESKHGTTTSVDTIHAHRDVVSAAVRPPEELAWVVHPYTAIIASESFVEVRHMSGEM